MSVSLFWGGSWLASKCVRAVIWGDAVRAERLRRREPFALISTALWGRFYLWQTGPAAHPLARTRILAGRTGAGGLFWALTTPDLTWMQVLLLPQQVQLAGSPGSRSLQHAGLANGTDANLSPRRGQNDQWDWMIGAKQPFLLSFFLFTLVQATCPWSEEWLIQKVILWIPTQTVVRALFFS